MTSRNHAPARPLLLAIAGIAGIAFGASLATATQAEARSVGEVQRGAKKPREIIKQHKIIKPLEPASEDNQNDRVPPRIRDFRKRIDRVPARPGARKKRHAEPRVRDFRPSPQADRVPALPGKRRSTRR